MNLKNKSAIVTGARRGIGKAIALDLAEKGAKVVVSDLKISDCQKVVKEIKKRGGEALAVKCDVTKKSEINNLLKKTKQKFKKIDILVSNAGVVVQKPFTKLTEKDWDFTLDINLKGAFLCAGAVAKQMEKQKSGKIIFISSIAGQVGFGNTSAYCASKAGIIGLAKGMALDLAESNIQVNVVAPGVIKTDMTEDMLKDPKTKKSLLSNIPMKKIGRTQDISQAVNFLASNQADYVTGETLTVDGGWVAH